MIITRNTKGKQIPWDVELTTEAILFATFISKSNYITDEEILITYTVKPLI